MLTNKKTSQQTPPRNKVDTNNKTHHRQVAYHEVGIDEYQQRIDNFLIRYYHSVPKSRVYRMLRHGEVRVNKGRSKASYKLQMGDQIRLPPCVIDETRKQANAYVNTSLVNQILQGILYEDDYLAVIDKPFGLAVHGGGKKGSADGLIEQLNRTQGWQKAELAHRLDKDTSGCLLVAKRRSVLRQLHQQFRQNEIKKVYTTIVHGVWSPKWQSVNEPLLRYLMPNGERRVKVNKQGQFALTHFDIAQKLTNCTMLKARLETGRTHQIRVHCQAKECPIIGDDKYGNRKLDQALMTQAQSNATNKAKLNRLALHANELSFVHPVNQHKVNVQSPLPNSFIKFIQAMSL